MTKIRSQHNPYPLGAHVEAGGIRFAYATKAVSCGVIIYNRKTGRQLRKEAFSAEEKVGNVYCKYIENLQADQIAYQFYEEERKLPDPFGRSFENGKGYGKLRNICDLKSLIPTEEFDWEGDRHPRLGYSESVGYCVHVRGFTAHSSSKVAYRGTYRGISRRKRVC